VPTIESRKGASVKLVKCGQCGQSVNRKRDVCPFCGAAVVKAQRPVLPPPRAHEVDDGADTASAAPSQSISVWWKRPNIVIPAVVGTVFLVIVLGVSISLIASQNADRKAAADAANAAAAQKAAATKAATAAAVEPFLQLAAALKVGIVFADYTKRVQAVQYAVDSYSPSDARGKSIKAHLTSAAASYAAALDSWNSQIQNGYGGNQQTAWVSASAEVDQAKALADGE
jgi:hypothetical protein